jgi:hypothetical protein
MVRLLLIWGFFFRFSGPMTTNKQLLPPKKLPFSVANTSPHFRQLPLILPLTSADIAFSSVIFTTDVSGEKNDFQS